MPVLRPTHTHTTVLLLFWNLSGTTRVSRYQKGKTRKVKTNLDLLEQETVSGRGICCAICKSAPHPRQPRQHPTTQFFTGRMPFLLPNQQRQSIEGNQSTEDLIIPKCYKAYFYVNLWFIGYFWPPKTRILPSMVYCPKISKDLSGILAMPRAKCWSVNSRRRKPRLNKKTHSKLSISPILHILLLLLRLLLPFYSPWTVSGTTQVSWYHMEE